MQDKQAIPSTAADPRRDRLREIIEEKSLITGRTFTLASGRTSSFFVNLKQTMLDPEGANLLADLVLDVMEAHGIQNIGGLEMGAVPLVSAVCTKSFGRFPVNTFFVRKTVKDHGTAELIDGQVLRESFGKVRVEADVEQILEPNPALGRPADYLMDMHMMAVFGQARERTEPEFRDLLDRCGFVLTRVVPTRSPVSIIEAKPVPASS